MTISLSKQQLLAYIAIVSLLLNALAPSVSHALAGKHTQEIWQQICSQTGTRFIHTELLLNHQNKQDSTQKQDKNQSGRMPMQDCGYCVSHAGSDNTFADSFAINTVRLVLGLYPALFYASPDKLFVWASASPRAPPLLSL